MKTVHWLFTVALGLFLTGDALQAADKFAILFSGSIQGETEPCG